LKHNKFIKTKVMTNRVFFSFFALIVTTFSLNANEAKITADTIEGLIGDKIAIRIIANGNPNFEYTFPDFNEKIGEMEVLDVGEIDTIALNGEFQLSKTIYATAFDTGSYNIGPFIVLYSKKDLPDPFPMTTDSITITIQTMEVDTAAGFIDLKGIKTVPFTYDEIIEYIIYGVIALIIIGLAFYFWKKRKKSDEPAPLFDPKVPAHILALESLEKLEKEKLWQQGYFKEYYTKLTDVLRIYIFRVYDIKTLEMTGNEIVEAVAKSSISIYTDKMRHIFFSADLAKFAKEQPISSENISALEYAKEFVIQTSPKETIISKNN